MPAAEWRGGHSQPQTHQGLQTRASVQSRCQSLGGVGACVPPTCRCARRGNSKHKTLLGQQNLNSGVQLEGAGLPVGLAAHEMRQHPRHGDASAQPMHLGAVGPRVAIAGAVGEVQGRRQTGLSAGRLQFAAGSNTPLRCNWVNSLGKVRPAAKDALHRQHQATHIMGLLLLQNQKNMPLKWSAGTPRPRSVMDTSTLLGSSFGSDIWMRTGSASSTSQAPKRVTTACSEGCEQRAEGVSPVGAANGRCQPAAEGGRASSGRPCKQARPRRAPRPEAGLLQAPPPGPRLRRVFQDL